MAEERNVGVTDVMRGNAAKAPIAPMLGAEQIVFEERDMRAIRNGSLPTSSWH